MAWDEIGESVCPVARSLAVLGDRWTMLIIRELFLGTRRFDVFQAQTGMSPHVLSTRLKRLEDDGVVERRRYQLRPPRYEYRLTAKGRDLHGVILALRTWGLRWCDFDSAAEPAVELFHTTCGGRVEPAAVCHDCGKPLRPHDITVRLSDAFDAERAVRGSRSGTAKSTA